MDYLVCHPRADQDHQRRLRGYLLRDRLHHCHPHVLYPTCSSSRVLSHKIDYQEAGKSPLCLSRCSVSHKYRSDCLHVQHEPLDIVGCLSTTKMVHETYPTSTECAPSSRSSLYVFLSWPSSCLSLIGVADRRVPQPGVLPPRVSRLRTK
jgi:hypothetical protein